MRTLPVAIALTALVAASGCKSASGKSSATGAQAAPKHASAAFWKHWADGKAELSGYSITTNRYGQMRKGQVVLVYVTENLDRRTMIKDDSVRAPHKLPVLKLNAMLKFRTGIYPYSVMTSVFAQTSSPAGRERFAPVKVAFSGQEWCGHVYHAIEPGATRFTNHMRSYFADEGNKSAAVQTPRGTLYGDALWIQLRELDGPFAGGKKWSGRLVPGLWSVRKAHTALMPVAATITRSDAKRGKAAVTRFVVAYAGAKKTIDVEKAMPRRILGWSGSDGERAQLLKTARLPYWQLNANGNESYLAKIGIKP